MIYALQEMFPGHSVKRAEDGTFEIEAPGEYTFPRVTLEQLGSLATAAAGRAIWVSARDHSRHYDSCSITKYVLVIGVG